MTVRLNRFDLVGICVGAEPGSERQRGSIMLGSEARKGSCGSPPGDFCRFGMHLKSAL